MDSCTNYIGFSVDISDPYDDLTLRRQGEAALEESLEVTSPTPT